MKTNFRKLIILFLLSISLSSFATPSEESAMQLAKRIIPAYSPDINFKQIETIDGKDVYTISSKDNKILIEGNNANSMATGLNFYLKYYCKVTVIWFKSDPIVLSAGLPMVEKKITVHAKLENRFFLNYVTFGYSMNWWKWNEWEHFIDWMALNGINMALATTGQESIWKSVWKEMGLTDAEIMSYFTGPSYLAWHRMANIDGWHSQMPNSWIERQEILQKQIIQREQELNIKPILLGFAGHVPKSLKGLYPNAKISDISAWTTFEKQYNTYCLNASDPLFKIIQKKFLQKQTQLYGGTSHIYGLDPFNEIDPPSWDTEYLANIARNIYESVSSVDHDAIWLQMTWLFYYKRHDWTPERVKAYLTAVPKGKLLLLDYYCDNTELWKQTESFYGQPYIWNYVGNLGGNSMICGNLKEMTVRVDNTFKNGGSNFSGVGAVMESLHVNPLVFDFLFEKAWERQFSDIMWIEKLADRRIGFADENMRKAWSLLYDKIYCDIAKNKSMMANARPSLNGKSYWNNALINYSNKDLLKVWELLLATKKSDSKNYQYDLVDVSRQVLDNYFSAIQIQYLVAYRKNDIASVEKIGKEMLEILTDMDRLVATNDQFLMGKWIKDARSWGDTPAEKDYFEKDARNILTTWGARGYRLNDYANRSWSGLINDFYKKRWEIFMKDIHFSLKNNTNFNEDKTYFKLTEFEWNWTSKKTKYYDSPKGNSYEISNELFKKYAVKVR